MRGLSWVTVEDKVPLLLFTEAVPPVPVAGRVVAGFVTVAVFDPRSWAALGTVGDRPGQVHLQRKRQINSQENSLSESTGKFYTKSGLYTFCPLEWV